MRRILLSRPGGFQFIWRFGSWGLGKASLAARNPNTLKSGLALKPFPCGKER